MKYDVHTPEPQNIVLNAWEDGGPEIRHPHSFGACLMISVMCHVLLVVSATGYGLDNGMRGHREGARVIAHFQEAGLPVPVQESEKQLLVPADSHDSSNTPPTALRNADQPEARAETPSVEDSGDLSAYIPVELLGSKPRFLNAPADIVPPRLGADEGGHVVVQLLVNAEGGVDTVAVERSELSVAGTRRFIQHLGSLQLEPGQLNGKPVKARWRLEFTLQPGPVDQSSPS